MAASTTNSEHTKLCQDMAEHAGNLILSAYQNSSSYTLKADHSFVTDTDKLVDEYYHQTIIKAYPGHNIHSEESADLDSHSDYTWYIDPLDGTSNFVFGVPLFGTQVALVNQNEVIASAVYLPMENCLFFAGIREGVTLNGHPLTLPPPTTLDKLTMVLDCGKSVEAKSRYSHLLQKIYPHIRSVRQFGCVISHLLCLQNGHLHLSMLFDVSGHDSYPVSLIYRELGFNLLNLQLNPWSTKDSDLINVHPSIKEDLVKIIS